MHQYLVSQGYWSYIEGAQDNQPNLAHVDHSSWKQVTSRMLYYLASCIVDHMLGYIRGAKTPKEVWGNLKKIVMANTTVEKLQLCQELEQHQTEGYVSRQLHFEDQGAM